MTNALIKAEDVDAIERIGRSMAASGYFSDAKEAAQAIVKICAGREMGFGPFASMTGINIIKGKPAIGGNLMAAAVKNHSKYDYRVVVLDAEVCELAKEDAQAAEVGKLVAPGASKSMMARFARNMLFNRAMSNGVRWYCPDVFLGSPVYTPEELGAQVDGEGEIINITPTVTRPTETAVSSTDGDDLQSNGEHWIDKQTRNGKKVSAAFWAWTSEQGLSDAEVYLALEVEHIHDYSGTMGDAKTTINEWVARQADAQAALEVDAEVSGE